MAEANSEGLVGEPRTVNGWTIADLAGEIDYSRSSKLKAALDPVLEKAGTSLILNLQKVGYLDSTALATLVACRRRTAEAVAARGLTNIRMLAVDARAVMLHHLEPASVQAVHIYYPDPWPKRRHAKRRIFQPDFLTAVVRVLRPGGLLSFQSDVKDY